jgi:hypothetical protein
VVTTLVVLINVPEMDVRPVPGAPPVKPVPAGAGQLYVVPVGIITAGGASVGAIENDPPLQIVVVCAGTKGLGLMVTVAVKLAPGQVPDKGVTV